MNDTHHLLHDYSVVLRRPSDQWFDDGYSTSNLYYVRTRNAARAIRAAQLRAARDEFDHEDEITQDQVHERAMEYAPEWVFNARVDVSSEPWEERA